MALNCCEQMESRWNRCTVSRDGGHATTQLSQELAAYAGYYYDYIFYYFLLIYFFTEILMIRQEDKNYVRSYFYYLLLLLLLLLFIIIKYYFISYYFTCLHFQQLPSCARLASQYLPPQISYSFENLSIAHGNHGLLLIPFVASSV